MTIVIIPVGNSIYSVDLYLITPLIWLFVNDSGCADDYDDGNDSGDDDDDNSGGGSDDGDDANIAW